MPCYGCQLKLSRRNNPIPLSNTKNVACHGKSLARPSILIVLALLFTQNLLPQISSTPQTTPAAPATTSETPPAPAPPSDGATVEKPDFSVKIPRIDAPPRGEYYIDSDSQEAEGGIYHLHGHVKIEVFDATFKADDAEYDENTDTFKAFGNVSYRSYVHDEVIYCDRAEYNAGTARGTFYHVKGYTKTKVVARQGMLTTQEPFYFEGERAEKMEEKYILYEGIITDCHIPHPWWTMNAHMWDIIPEDRAITHGGVFHLRGIPLFYTPYFYKALRKEPRKSGFLTPEAGHSSLYGYFVGGGYYWAINRSYDVEYLATDYTSRGVAHHLDIRGKPNEVTDFNIIAFGIDDHGGGTLSNAPGASVSGTFKTQFGDGWIARANIDYISSYLFRQVFSGSFNEAIYSSTNSSAFASKNFGYYAVNIDVSENKNFESTTSGDTVTIRKLPEVEFLGRDQQIASGNIPLWFSFDSSVAAFHRADPTSEPGFYETNQFTPRGDIEPSISSVFQWEGLSIVPTFTMHETFYGQSIVGTTIHSTALNRAAPEMNIDIVLPSISRVYNRKTFLGDRIKHVIEPRLNYKYITGVNDFANTLRFDQIDLLADTSELEVGLTNRIYVKTKDTVKEVFTWEVFEKRFFDPTFGGAVVAGQRNVTLASLDLTGFSFLDGPRNYSPIVNIMRIVPITGVSIRWEGDYDPLLHRFTNSMFSADLRHKKYFLSAGSTQVKPNPVVSGPANQLFAQLGYGDPNHKGWNGAVSTVYDLRLGIQEFAVGQVTYNTDCCGFSVEYRRTNFGVRDDTTYRLAFTIANIGTFGNLKKQERLF
jgi:LPS-assembly protein